MHGRAVKAWEPRARSSASPRPGQLTRPSARRFPHEEGNLTHKDSQLNENALRAVPGRTSAQQVGAMGTAGEFAE